MRRNYCMKNFEELKKLFNEGRWDEARSALASLVGSDDFIKDQAGSAYLTLLMTYVDSLRAIQSRYHAALDAGIAILRVANQREAEMKDAVLI